MKNRPTALLILGAASGIVLAASGLLGANAPGRRALPSDAVARVNGELIRVDDYQRVLSALAQDRRDSLTPADRHLVLNRLIEEELLVQRGLDLGFARQDSKVRKDIVAAVIDSVVSESGDKQPTDAQVQAFYDEQRDFFTGPGRVRVRQIWVRAATAADAPAALERAQQATQRLRAGEDFATVHDALADPELVPLPDALLPPTKLGDYLGPTALRTVLSLEPGAVSDPIRSNTGYHVLQVVERQSATAPPLAEIKPQVEIELRRRAADEALRSYLDGLRSRAHIDVAATLPQ